MTQTIKFESGQTYDGKGETIEAAGFTGTIFAVFGVADVTIKNVVINAGPGVLVADIGNSKNVTIQNVRIVGEAKHGVYSRRCSDVTVDGVSADWLDRYLVYVDNTDRITISNCSLTGGSRNETGLRLMENITNVTLKDNRIVNGGWKETALRCHGGGSGVTVIGGTYVGQTAFGPMGEGDGGQSETDPAKRKTLLGYRLKGVSITGATFRGGLYLVAGLEDCTFRGCSLEGIKSKQNVNGQCVSKLTPVYPDAKHIAPGDIARGYPQVTFEKCTFVSPCSTVCYGGNDGNFAYRACTKNGLPLGTKEIIVANIKISGVVFGDSDSDGVFSRKKDSVAAGKVVNLVQGGKVIKTATCDQWGYYEFNNLANGAYVITRDFPKGWQISNPSKKGGTGIDVLITDGQSVSNVNIGSIPAGTTKPNVSSSSSSSNAPSSSSSSGHTQEPEPDPKPDTDGTKKMRIGMVSMTSIDPSLPVTSAKWSGTKTTAEAYRAIGVVGMREWFTLGGTMGFGTIRKWIAAGVTELTITLNFKGSKLPTPDEITKAVKAFVAQIPDDVRPHIKYIVVGNEPGIGEYWRTIGENAKGSTDNALRNFVTLFLNPAYEVLKAAGFTVGFGGLNGAFADQFRTIQAAGAKYDVIDIHPYQKSVSMLKTHWEKLVALNVPAKPIISTEWNVFLGPEYREYLDGAADGDAGASEDRVIQQQKDQYAYLASLANPPKDLYYFVSYQDFKWTTGPFGALIPQKDSSGKTVGYRTSPFYDGFLWGLAH